MRDILSAGQAFGMGLSYGTIGGVVVAGPYNVDAKQAYAAGSTVSHVHIAGAEQAQVGPPS
jgi:hypothetical protein